MKREIERSKRGESERRERVREETAKERKKDR